jgi:hypothetical protein
VGAPLIKPKIPYQFKVKTFESKNEWTKLQKIQMRGKFTVESFIEYLTDIILGRVDPFVFKTAGFCKRNYNRVKHVLQHALYELRKIKQGW